MGIDFSFRGKYSILSPEQLVTDEMIADSEAKQQGVQKYYQVNCGILGCPANPMCSQINCGVCAMVNCLTE
jgi:hypothetical protein